MFDKLPKTVDAERLAQYGADFKGEYPLNAMARLSELAESDSGECSVDLVLSTAEGSRLILRGQLQASVELVCQRCLDTFTCPLTAEVDVELVREETDAHREHDVFVLDEEGSLPLVELVEDELLLQLPNMPKHADIADCNQDMIARATEYVPDEAEEEKQNPFAILKDLKK